jgi:hypothetical protein
MLKTRIQICIVYSISYLFAIKEKTDYRINTVSDRFHPYLLVTQLKFVSGLEGSIAPEWQRIIS